MEIKQFKHSSDSLTEQVHWIRYSQINGYGRLFGGQLMHWIDETAGIVARRHCGMTVTTAAIDNLSFKEAAHINDMVVVIGRITFVGHSSMEIRVDTYVEDQKGMRQNINRAYVVMVAIDENGQALEVPGLLVESVSEKAEWESGRKRYELRKQRHKEGY